MEGETLSHGGRVCGHTVCQMPDNIPELVLHLLPRRGWGLPSRMPSMHTNQIKEEIRKKEAHWHPLSLFVRMFRADRRDDSICKSGCVILLCLINSMRDARLALSHVYALTAMCHVRGVLVIVRQPLWDLVRCLGRVVNE